ncbi:GerAB/ArcD/ProY family transporter [Clostridium malenominatum]|uniref:GerAB/ArcD/ProY family transporter n=1 Tax=Clostridium malenominatum TaxID=1539 RepID=A0ABN1IML5_9CLOT
MNNSLTNKEISFVLYCVIVGYGVINLPKTVAEASGTSGWISMFIMGSVAIIVTYMITYISYVHEDKVFYEFSEILVGKIFTYIFLTIYIIYFFISFTMLTRIYAETINLTILNRTPVWSISLLFFIVIYYALSKGLPTIGRISLLYGFMSLLGFIFLNTILASQGKLVNIRPLFISKSIVSYIKDSFKLVFPFLGMEILFFIPINRKYNKKILKYTICTLFFITLLYFYTVESSISVIGVESIIHYKTPLFSVVKGLDVPYLEFFRRLDGIYIIYWSMNIICSISIWGYVLTLCINKFFKNLQYNTLIKLVVIISFIASQIPKTTKDVEQLLKFSGYLGIVTTLIIPFILLIMTKVKNHGKKIH